MVLAPDPATALPCLLFADLALPDHAQNPRSRPQLGLIVWLIAHVAPAAGDATGREGRLAA